jgi:hypothetical protein
LYKFRVRRAIATIQEISVDSRGITKALYKGVKGVVMRDNERWIQLCQLITVEYDPKKMLLLVEELNALLKEQDVQNKRSNSRAESPSLAKQAKHG